MTEGEREMLRRPEPATPYGERATSLQPTYEDSVEPDPEGSEPESWGD